MAGAASDKRHQDAQCSETAFLLRFLVVVAAAAGCTHSDEFMKNERVRCAVQAAPSGTPVADVIRPINRFKMKITMIK